MTYDYQKTNRYFAQVADDIKDIAEDELQSLGAIEISQAYRGIYFNASPAVLYSVNFHSRLLSRVLAPLLSFKCHTDKVLYKRASEIHWQDFLKPSQTFAVFASVSHSAMRHSKFAALRLKDAVVDTFRAQTGQRPSIDTRNPDVWFNLHIENDQATISLDASGGSLHRRGYRQKSVEAPMIETLAAAIIKFSEWDGRVPLCDPFCGSGTLLCEGYLSASKTPPAILRRKFGFQNLPDFNASLWKQVKQEGMQKIEPISKNIIAGSDISLEAVKSSAQNCSVIDKENVIKIEQQDVFDIEEIKEKTIICNPPYGIRMGQNVDLSDFYKRFGDFLKQRCSGSTAYIYFGERQYIKNIGLKPSWKKILSNSGLDGRLAKYELY
ncbi:class I SAM-dependent RNA methyltransferase [candidate division KSB1 bacterium]|nr:class I SAM-dependent RNA methyltransferase [candidate division KSB1 bacterium]